MIDFLLGWLRCRHHTAAQARPTLHLGGALRYRRLDDWAYVASRFVGRVLRSAKPSADRFSGAQAAD